MILHTTEIHEEHRDVIEQMRKLVLAQTIPPVIMFHGAQGVGQQRVMTEVARMAVCFNRHEGCIDPPDCAGGVWFDQSRHHDVLQLPEEDQYNKEWSLAIHNHLLVYPSRAVWRIVMIPHVDRFHQQSAQLLLKIFEEPPPNALVLMSTYRRHVLLPTLRSRVVHCLIRPYSFACFKQQLVEFWQHSRGDKLPAAWVEGLFKLSAGSLGEAIYMLQNQQMLADLQTVLAAGYAICLLPDQVSAFLNKHELNSQELLYAIELCLARMYQRGEQHSVLRVAAQRRSMLMIYHRALAHHNYALQPQMLLQGCVGTSFMGHDLLKPAQM